MPPKTNSKAGAQAPTSAPKRRPSAADSFGEEADGATQKRPRRDKVGKADYREGDTDPGEESKELIASQLFWTRWHPDLVLAWLEEFALKAKVSAEEREDPVATLALRRKEFPQPKEGVEVVQLQQCWSRMNGNAGPCHPGEAGDMVGEDEEEDEPDELLPIPGAQTPVQVAPSSAAAMSSLASSRPGPPLQAPVFAIPAAATPGLGAQAPSDWVAQFQAQAQQQAQVLAQLQAQLRELQAPAVQPVAQAPVAPVALAQLAPAGAPVATCGWCGEPAAASVRRLDVSWKCTSCTMRGDHSEDARQVNSLCAGHAHALRLKAMETASTVPASVAPQSGQSSTVLESKGSGARGIDLYFERLVREAPTAAAFIPTATPEESAALVDAAFAAGRSSYNYHFYQAPSAPLLLAIQAGKLPNIGWAIPAPVGGPGSAMGSSVQVEGITVQKTADLEPPPLTSAADFARAMFGVILPALAAQPRATAQWLSFARTLLEIESKLGWKAAAEYAKQMLHHRVAQGAPLEDVNHSAILALQADAVQRPPPSYASGGGGNNGGGICNIFRQVGSCARGDQCIFRHVDANGTVIPTHGRGAKGGSQRGGKGHRGGRGGPSSSGRSQASVADSVASAKVPTAEK